MNNPFHKLAVYTATILISSLPFTATVVEAEEKIKKQHSSKVNNVKTDNWERNEILRQNQYDKYFKP